MATLPEEWLGFQRLFNFGRGRRYNAAEDADIEARTNQARLAANIAQYARDYFRTNETQTPPIQAARSEEQRMGQTVPAANRATVASAQAQELQNRISEYIHGRRMGTDTELDRRLGEGPHEAVSGFNTIRGQQAGVRAQEAGATAGELANRGTEESLDVFKNNPDLKKTFGVQYKMQPNTTAEANVLSSMSAAEQAKATQQMHALATYLGFMPPGAGQEAGYARLADLTGTPAVVGNLIAAESARKADELRRQGQKPPTPKTPYSETARDTGAVGVSRRVEEEHPYVARAAQELFNPLEGSLASKLVRGAVAIPDMMHAFQPGTAEHGQLMSALYQFLFGQQGLRPSPSVQDQGPPQLSPWE